MPVFDSESSRGGLSTAAVIFIALLMYTLLLHAGNLITASFTRVMWVSALVLATSILMEGITDHPMLGRPFRYLQMFIALATVAALCRDRQSVKVVLWGFAIAGLWHSLSLLINLHGVLSGADVDNFKEATTLREKTFAHADFSVNLNRLAFFCSQGWTALLFLALDARKNAQRATLFLLASVCLLASFLTMSRSGLLFCIVPGVFALYHFGKGNLRQVGTGPILMAILFIGIAVSLIPSAALVRFSSTTMERKKDARARVYSAAIDGFNEYYALGVGEYGYTSWALQHGVYGITDRGRKLPLGMHNAFLQFWVLWGLPAFLSLILFVWVVYRMLPARTEGEILAIAVWAIAAGLLLRMMFSHSFAGKEFSIGVGMILGSSLWVWRRASPAANAMHAR